MAGAMQRRSAATAKKTAAKTARKKPKVRIEDEEAAAPLDDEAAGQSARISAGYRMKLAREKGLRALAAARARPADDWRGVLLPAARSIHDALASFYELERLGEFVVDELRTHQDQLLEITRVLDQDLDSLLVLMGYTPPPPSTELALDLKECLAEYVSADAPGQRASIRRRAVASVFCFRYHLGELIKLAESETAAPSDDAEDSIRHRVLRSVDTATKALLPAIISTVGVAVAFPPAGEAAAPVLGVLALEAGAKAALGVGLKAAGSLLTDRLFSSPPIAEPTARAYCSLRHAAVVLGLQIKIAEDMQAGQEASSEFEIVQICGILVLDALYDALSSVVTTGGTGIVYETICQSTLRELSECRDPETGSFGPEGLSAHAEELFEHVEALSEAANVLEADL
jgi:hypothetical protein